MRRPASAPTRSAGASSARSRRHVEREALRHTCRHMCSAAMQRELAMWQQQCQSAGIVWQISQGWVQTPTGSPHPIKTNPP